MMSASFPAPSSIPCLDSHNNFATLVARGVVLMETAQFPIPVARRCAAVESIKHAQDEDTLIDIFLETITGSPYVNDEAKAPLANLVLQAKWEELAQQAGCTARLTQDRLQQVVEEQCDDAEQFTQFRFMVLNLFGKSRKVDQGLSLAQKRALGGAILATETGDQLMDLLLCTLSNDDDNHFLDSEAKEKTVNDVLEGRYYRLLLPDRLDCDCLPRQNEDGTEHQPPQQQPPEGGDCVICFQPLSSNQTHLPDCNHTFCTDCIRDWWTEYDDESGSSTRRDERSCPLCRGLGFM